jgi:diguanylate cyclase (GGDEF)-like protein
VILIGVAAVAWLWRLGLSWLEPGAAWMLVQVPLGICTASLAWRFAARHERQWIRPAHQLERLIAEARNGMAPIESLSEVHGPIAPLARMAQELLHDLRRGQQEKSRIQSELNQRVRQRTNVLESKVSAWQTQAYRDALTGLYNRRRLDEQLPRLIEQCSADGTTLCVLAMDLDHFKKLNDTLGHAAGDRLLRDVGQIINSAVREEDLAFRMGGDEFLILLPGHDTSAGLRLARRLNALVNQLTANARSTPKPGISIGVTCLTDLRKIAAADLLRVADAAMYQDKTTRKAGR